MAQTKPRRNLLQLRSAVWVLSVIGLSFAYGVGVGFYRWPPFSVLKTIQDAVANYRSGRHPGAYQGEKELLQFAFTDPLISSEQILAPISSLDGIYEVNRSILLSADEFYHAYDSIQITEATRLTLDRGATKVLKVSYELSGVLYTAYAYVADAVGSCPGAALIIPGSGWNQSSAIYGDDPSNYQFGIMEALDPSLERYVLIKPNEDCLAFHDTSHKLGKNFYVNWLLDMGGSYSAQYIASSLAITKYLQSQFPTVVIAGLSQGGHAALLNALQSQPQVAIILSGFSILGARVKWAGHNQIIIPGLQQRLTNDEIRSRIRLLPTRFLFTYGKAEHSTYRIEAFDHLTCDFLSGLSNVECGIHDGKHSVPVSMVKEFIRRKLSQSG